MEAARSSGSTEAEAVQLVAPGTPIRIRLGSNNVYAVRGRKRAVLIDAGPDYDGAWEKLTAQLAAHDLTPSDVRAVVLTHNHRDHVGLAARWQEAGASIQVGWQDAEGLALDAAARQALRERAAAVLVEHGVPAELARSTLLARRSTTDDHGDWPGPLGMTPVRPDRLLDHGSVIADDGIHLRIGEEPGHTPGTICLWDTSREGAYGVFSGDHLLPRTVATVGIHFHAGARLPSLPSYVKSLEGLRIFRGWRAWPGHGDVIPDVVEEMGWSLRYIERRAGRLRRRLSRESKTAYELATSVFPHLDPRHITTVMAETIGLLDLLEERGEAVSERRTGQVVYRTSAIAGGPAGAEEFPP